MENKLIFEFIDADNIAFRVYAISGNKYTFSAFDLDANENAGIFLIFDNEEKAVNYFKKVIEKIKKAGK